MLVRAGRIEEIGTRASVKIPAGATRHDLAGKTIIPGLINAHGHVGDTRGLKAGPELYTRENVLAQLGMYGRYGVTTVYSLGGDQEEDSRSATRRTCRRSGMRGCSSRERSSPVIRRTRRVRLLDASPR